MGNLINLLSANKVNFPIGEAGGWFPFLGEMTYGIVKWIHNNGAIGYGLAIILFTVILKLIMLPLDFLMKYMTKKNSNKMAEMKPELDDVKRQYAADPRQMLAAQQEVYRKHNYKMGGFLLFMMINMFITCAVFLQVFGALRDVSDYNIKLTVRDMQADYRIYYDESGGEWIDKSEVNETYGDRMVGLLWIKNIWRSDTPFTSANISKDEYVKNASKSYMGMIDNPDYDSNIPTDPDTNPEQIMGMIYLSKSDLGKEYETIFKAISSKHKRDWNGMFLLIILAGVVTWLSTVLNARMMAKKREKEKDNKEEVIDYSMRDARNRADVNTPVIDPAQMNRMMKFILPAVMVIFTLMSTSAVAIYIITSSVMGTLTTLACAKPVDKLVEMKEKRERARGENAKIDPTIINPHSKYFKNKRK